MPTGEQKQKKRTFDVLPKPDKLIRSRQQPSKQPPLAGKGGTTRRRRPIPSPHGILTSLINSPGESGPVVSPSEGSGSDLLSPRWLRPLIVLLVILLHAAAWIALSNASPQPPPAVAIVDVTIVAAGDEATVTTATAEAAPHAGQGAPEAKSAQVETSQGQEPAQQSAPEVAPPPETPPPQIETALRAGIHRRLRPRPRRRLKTSNRPNLSAPILRPGTLSRRPSPNRPNAQAPSSTNPSLLSPRRSAANRRQAGQAHPRPIMSGWLKGKRPTCMGRARITRRLWSRRFDSASFLSGRGAGPKRAGRRRNFVHGRREAGECRRLRSSDPQDSLIWIAPRAKSCARVHKNISPERLRTNSGTAGRRPQINSSPSS